MNICFLNMPIEYYSPASGGAISTIIMQMAREFIERGHQVTVLSITDGEEIYKVGKVVPIQAKTRNDLHFLQRRLSSVKGKLNQWDWPYYEFYLRSSLKALKALSPAPEAVILFNDLVSPKYIKKALPGARVYVWLQNEQRTKQQDLSKTVAGTQKFLTCSGYIREWTSKHHSIPLNKFCVALSGVDLKAFYPREDYLEKPETLRVLFIGRIDPNKGPDIAADAVATLQEKGLAVSLTVAGGLWFYGHGKEMDDPFFRLLKSKMDRVKAEYLGHVARPAVPELVRRHDVVCVLSRSNEPFGLVVLEAMASGCAVVASNRGGLPEACGDAGLLVDPDDLKAVTNALRGLAVDHEELKAQKIKSLHRAAQVSWSATADVVESVLMQQD